MKLLEDLEQLQLIRLHKEKSKAESNWPQRYKGAMTKQPIKEITDQLDQLRNK